jgi:twitching motility protein PilT
VRVLDLLRDAVAAGASDLHLKGGSPARLRVEGRLRDRGRALDPAEVHAMATALMGPQQVERYEAEGDLELIFPVEELGRFRVSVMRERGQTSVAVRCIPAKIPTIDSLGISPVARTLAERPRGLVLVTGPTGSGKSHTLAAMVDHVNRTRACHILTMEDPIEFVHKDIQAHITQREIGRDCPDFPTALRRALRHDPDVILVGEMRDRETISLALTAAETGHLVLSTLHTIDAVETIHRVISVFPPHQQMQIRLQLAGILRGVVSQRLVPRADGKGMVPAVEILVASARVRELIETPERTREIRDAIAQGRDPYGMISFDQCLIDLVQRRLVTYEEALRHSTTPDDFALAFRGVSGGGTAEGWQQEQVRKQNLPASPPGDPDFQIERFGKE